MCIRDRSHRWRTEGPRSRGDSRIAAIADSHCQYCLLWLQERPADRPGSTLRRSLPAQPILQWRPRTSHRLRQGGHSLCPSRALRPAVFHSPGRLRRLCAPTLPGRRKELPYSRHRLHRWQTSLCCDRKHALPPPQATGESGTRVPSGPPEVKGHRQTLWYWLVPGIRVKRYLLLFVAGTALLVLAIDGLLQTPGTSWLLNLRPSVQHVLRRFLPSGAVSPVFAVLCGIAVMVSAWLMVLAAALLARSLLVAVTGSIPRESFARTIYRYRKAESLPRVVVIGGGTGIKPIIESLRTENVKLTTIVTMADSGGSTGRLRETTGMLPPGDFRNALIAMAGESTRSARLLAYRFPEQLEGIGGHNVGNLMIAALSDIKGNFGDAVQELSELMQLPGRVLPMSLDNISLRAHFTDGTTSDGEDQVPLQGKTIDTIEVLPPHAKPFVPALEALSRADYIIIGPGSLFTSLIPPCPSRQPPTRSYALQPRSSWS